jgi:dihydrofolate reductase
MPRSFAIVVAADRNRGIGSHGTLPWKLPGDMAFFKQITSETRAPGKVNAVIMGRKTWDSIPPKFRPLKGRLNVVLTRNRQTQYPEEIKTAASLDEAVRICDQPTIEQVFVIGGGAVYQQALHHPCCELVYLTEIDASFDCDTFLPAFADNFEQITMPHVHGDVKSDGDVRYRFTVYKRVNPDSASHNRAATANV